MIPATHCPMCNGSGRIEITDAVDPEGGIQGSFSYRSCEKCGSLWMDPKPASERIADLYPKNYYTHNTVSKRSLDLLEWRSQIATLIVGNTYGYTGLLNKQVPGYLKLFVKLLSISPSIVRRAGFHVRYLHSVPGGRLLEVGVGSGQFLRFMTDQGWISHGIDPDPIAVEVARKRGLSVEVACVEDFTPDIDGYDAICMTHVVEHLINPAEALSKLFSALKPGGVIVTLSPNPLSVYERRYRRNWRDLDTPRHLVFPSPNALRRQFVKLGASPVIVRTRTRAGIAVAHQSMNLRDYGPDGLYNSRSRLATRIEHLRMLLNELRAVDGGNEVVCIAEKPRCHHASG